jgi:glutaredoxin
VSSAGEERIEARTPRLQLLTRVGCHLCEAATETLRAVGADAGLEPVAVDVDTDPELQAEYGDRVPVVLLDGREHSYFDVDVPRLRRDLGLS